METEELREALYRVLKEDVTTELHLMEHDKIRVTGKVLKVLSEHCWLKNRSLALPNSYNPEMISCLNRLCDTNNLSIQTTSKLLNDLISCILSVLINGGFRQVKEIEVK